MTWEWFRGDYATWAEAAARCGSYADGAILERVVAASRRVRDGQAAYERDGFAFTEPRLNHPLLAALFRAAVGSHGELRVIDFGGAMGSLYWQHRHAFTGLRHLEWRVVEQAHYVAAGRREFETPALSFWPDLRSASEGPPANVAVLSSVLQYIPEPYAVIDEVVRLGPAWIFIDRLPLLEGPTDRLTIEHVPPDIGTETYPAWFLSEERFVKAVSGRYRTVDRFRTCLEGGPERWDVLGTTVDNQGFLLAFGEGGPGSRAVPRERPR